MPGPATRRRRRAAWRGRRGSRAASPLPGPARTRRGGVRTPTLPPAASARRRMRSYGDTIRNSACQSATLGTEVVYCVPGSVAQCRGVELLQARVCVSPIDHKPLSALLRRVVHHLGELHLTVATEW